MLEAKLASDFRRVYEIAVDGRPVTTWEGRLFREGGAFDLEGRRYEVRPNLWRTQYELTDQLGMVVAQADRVGRRRWTVAASGRVYEFRRRPIGSIRQLNDLLSWQRDDALLVEDGRPVGSIRKLNDFLDAVADLPGLPLPVQVFVLVVMQAVWGRRRD